MIHGTAERKYLFIIGTGRIKKCHIRIFILSIREYRRISINRRLCRLRSIRFRKIFHKPYSSHRTATALYGYRARQELNHILLHRGRPYGLWIRKILSFTSNQPTRPECRCLYGKTAYKSSFFVKHRKWSTYVDTAKSVHRQGGLYPCRFF